MSLRPWVHRSREESSAPSVWCRASVSGRTRSLRWVEREERSHVAARVRRIRNNGGELSQQTGLYSSRELGYNYRLTAMQAALGRCQLGRLDDYIAARRRNAAHLSAGLREVDGIETPTEGAECTHAYWKYVCRLRSDTFQATIATFV